VRHVGAHLDVNIDEAAVCHGHSGFVSGNLLAVGCAAHGLQHSGFQNGFKSICQWKPHACIDKLNLVTDVICRMFDAI
jgi:hypothetical protein